MTTPVRFDGFPAEAFDFYDALAANNTRPWWNDHKADYPRLVRDPLTALLDELSDEFGTPHLFRPYRDARFSKDKTPIKDHQGGTVEVEDAIAYYVQVSAAGLMVAGGWYAPQGQQVHRYRAVRRRTGRRRARAHRHVAVPTVRDRRPTGQDPAARLRRRPSRGSTCCATGRWWPCARYPVEPWLGTRKALTTVRSDWRALRPLIEWLADNVGPATDPGREE